MKRTLIALSCLVLFALPAFGQGGILNDSVLRADGRPAIGATVRVCTEAASGTPCSPTASIWSDKALTVSKTNPIAVDSAAAYTYYAFPGFYKEQLCLGATCVTRTVLVPIDGANVTVSTWNKIRVVHGSSEFTTIQVAHDNLPPGGGIVIDRREGAVTITTKVSITKDDVALFLSPGVNYTCSSVDCFEINGASRVRIFGPTRFTLSGSTIFGVDFVGTIDDVVVDGLTIIGDGVTASAQKGIGNSASGQTLTNIRVLNNNVQDVINGIAFSDESGGSVDELLIQGNHIKQIKGTGAGQGYGIFVWADNVQVVDNWIEDAGRHELYLSGGINHVVKGNIFTKHRDTEGDDATSRAAINVGTPDNVTIQGNIFDQNDGGNITVLGDGASAASITQNVTVIGNIFYLGVLHDFMVGQTTGPDSTEDSSADNGKVQNITFEGNTIYRTSVTTASVQVNYGLDVLIQGNNFWGAANSASSLRMISLDALDEEDVAGYTDNIIIKNNYGRVSNAGAGVGQFIRINDSIAVPTANAAKLVMRGNHVNTDDGEYSFQSVPTNASIQTFDENDVQNVFNGATETDHIRFADKIYWLDGLSFAGILSHANTAERAYNFPDATTVLAGLAVAQTFTADQTIPVITPLEGAFTNVPRWIFKQVDFGDMTAAATADTFTLWSLPSNTMIHDVVGTVVTGWSGGTISAAVCSVGTAAGAANDLALDDNFFAAATVYELHDATASGGKGTLLFDTTDKFAPSMFVAGGVVEIQCDLTGDNHVNATAGQARIYILVSQPLGNTATEAN